MEDILKTYKFPILGALIGLVLAISFFSIGFFKTLVLILLILLGGYIGYYFQKSDFLKNKK